VLCPKNGDFANPGTASSAIIPTSEQVLPDSFNFGPTLSSWHSNRQAPRKDFMTHCGEAGHQQSRAIISGPWLGGFGKPTNQMNFMPRWPTGRARITQVSSKWGIRDLNSFGRLPGRQWLAGGKPRSDTEKTLECMQANERQISKFNILAASSSQGAFVNAGSVSWQMSAA